MDLSVLCIGVTDLCLIIEDSFTPHAFHIFTTCSAHKDVPSLVFSCPVLIYREPFCQNVWNFTCAAVMLRSEREDGRHLRRLVN